MNKRDSYAVRISGLGEGRHDFSFELDQQFFDSYEYPEVKDGNVVANVLLEKKHGVTSLQFSLKGNVEVICDRCLEPFSTEIKAIQSLYVRIGDETEEIEDDVVVIGKDDHEIEVGQYLYEFIILALPFKKIHPQDKRGHSRCNPAMLEKLKAHRSRDTDQKEKTDPRWDALKGIIEKNN